MRDSLNTSLISNNRTTNFRNIVIVIWKPKQQREKQNGDDIKSACLRARNFSLAPIALRIGPTLNRADV